MVLDPGTFPHAHLRRVLRCWLPENEVLGHVRHRVISGLNPFTCVWPIIPFPPASRVQLPSPVRSSVLVRWLAFGQVGLPNSLTSGLLGALIGQSSSFCLLCNRRPHNYTISAGGLTTLSCFLNMVTLAENLTAPTTLRGFKGNQLRVAGLPTIALAAVGLFVGNAYGNQHVVCVYIIEPERSQALHRLNQQHDSKAG